MDLASGGRSERRIRAAKWRLPAVFRGTVTALESEHPLPAAEEVPFVRTAPVARCALLLSLAVLLAACASAPGGQAPAPLDELVGADEHGVVALAWVHDGELTSAYRVIRRTLPNAGTQTLAELDEGARSFVDHHAEVGASYSYTVVPLGLGGQAASGTAQSVTVTVEPGLTMVAGHYVWTGGGSPTMAFGFFFYFPRSDWPAASAPYTVSGPPGWNDDQPWTGVFQRDHFRGGFNWFAVPSGPAVPGAYQVEVEMADGLLLASSTLEEVGEVPRLEGLELLASSADAVTVGWDAYPGAQSYVVTLFEGVPGSATTVLSRRVSGTEATLDGLSLTPGEHFVAVSSYAFDGLQPGRSLPPERFDVAEAATEVFAVAAD